MTKEMDKAEKKAHEFAKELFDVEDSDDYAIAHGGFLAGRSSRYEEVAKKDARIRELEEALVWTKEQYWSRCYDGSGDIRGVTVAEFDRHIDAALTHGSGEVESE